jgi:acylaminoacyl-peptidase
VLFQGDKFVLRECWGEQMPEVKNPVICIMDVPSGNVTILEGLPDDISPAQVGVSVYCTLFLQ